MSPTEPVRPLHDVWLRPRRVFRALALQPVAAVDYLLGAAQGVANYLALSRAQNAGATMGITQIFLRAIGFGSVVGIASLLLMGMIYTRLAVRTGHAATRRQVLHVLAYGNVPLAASLVVWVFAALLTGEATFEQAPSGDTEAFVVLLLRIQFIAFLLLAFWSVVIQVMGFSEIQRLSTAKAFALWTLGQLIGLLALLFVAILFVTLFPTVAPA